MSKPKIVVVGSSNTDMIVKSPHIPAPGETVLGGIFATAAGGKGANQAVAAARAGGEVVFVARVGDDMFGAQAIAGFEREGIDCSKIIRDPANASGVALIMVDDQGQNSISVALGANNALSPSDVDAASDAIAAADMLVVQLEIPIATVERAVQLAKRANVPVLLDPAPAPEVALPSSILDCVTIIKPNETEAQRLTGQTVTDASSAEKAARELLNGGVETAIVTLGRSGSVVVPRSGAAFVVDSRQVAAVDATAAGDAYSGALAVALAEGMTLATAVDFATRAAALSVRKLGAQPSLATRDEIDAFQV